MHNLQTLHPEYKYCTQAQPLPVGAITQQESDRDTQNSQHHRGPRTVQVSAFPAVLCCAFLLCDEKSRLSVEGDHTSSMAKTSPFGRDRQMQCLSQCRTRRLKQTLHYPFHVLAFVLRMI